ncbi:hypothetical protein D0862_01030 [Hortaea werneckii]|uniref:DUF6697 domain-containing protein n=1 Tax=Hortaea werneckii TaxID=91943 RepID=A0A3M7HV27_HORWE|nr:hypothetical protein D0862_01030 [Hortaea werneckii]
MPPLNQKASHGGVSNNMAFPTRPYTHPNHRDHQPLPQNPMQPWSSHTNGLNPRTPGFIPTGMEIQPFHPSTTSSSYPDNTTNSYQITNPSNNINTNNNSYPLTPIPDPATFADFQNYVYRQHINHLNGISQLQTASRETDEAIAETREVVRKDLAILYRLLQQQERRIEELALSSGGAAGDGAGAGGEGEGGVEQRSLQAVVEQKIDGVGEPGIWDLEVVEPGVMLERFDPEVVAELYEEQAAKMGEVVQRLRGFAALARKEVDGGELGGEVGGVTNGDRSSLVVDGIGNASRDFASGNTGEIVESSEGQTKLVADCKEVKSAVRDGGRDTPKSSAQVEETARAATPVSQNNTTIQPSTTTPWIPCALRDLQPTKPTLLSDPIQTFTWEFLFNTLSGVQWSPGFYFNPNPSPSNLPPTKSYWLLDTPYEPFLPSQPGQPGAKITAFFNDTVPTSEEEAGHSAAPTEEDYLNTPIFISPDPLDVPTDERRYTYFGRYSQKRFSDRIGYDTVRDHIPKTVLGFWADSLASPERPEWITRQLMRGFWPRPVYEGPVFAEDAGETGSVGSGSEEVEDERVLYVLKGYARELGEWEREARKRVGLLKSEDLLESFEMSDAAAQPGLRLWWEYFEFVEFDREFYDGLVDAQEKRGEEKKVAAVKMKKREAAARRGKEENIHPMPAYVKEDARMEKEGGIAHALATNPFSAQNGGSDSEQTANPLTKKYHHPYFPDINEQCSPPPSSISKAGAKCSPPSRPTKTEPKSPLPSNDWSSGPQLDQPTESTWVTNPSGLDTAWTSPKEASPPTNPTVTNGHPTPQPERNPNGPSPSQQHSTKKPTRDGPTQSSLPPTTSTTTAATAGKVSHPTSPPSHDTNAKALEDARRFQQNATKARERRGGAGAGGRGAPPHLRRRA